MAELVLIIGCTTRAVCADLSGVIGRMGGLPSMPE